MINKQIDTIIKALEIVREKPMMFVGTDLSAITHFLNGFDLALNIIRVIDNQKTIYDEVVVERGWRISPSLTNEMKERGLDEEKIAHELLTLHIETWRRLKNRAAEDTHHEREAS